jgi:hypothetical protein
MEMSMQAWERTLQALASMSDKQAALVVLFFVFSLVAGNGVVALHYRRVGKPVLRSLLSPTSFPFLNFNAREWLMLAGVFVSSMAIIMLAVLWGGR